jgi:putative ABC transport system ATP-binding protein
VPAWAEDFKNEIKLSAILQIKNLVKIYSTGDISVKALKGVNLSIEKGEFVAIMGTSGSGKSTLMNILGCLDYPSSGEYMLDGVLVNTLSKKQLADIRNRKIGFVFQGFNLLSRTTAIENVELPLVYNRQHKGISLKNAAIEALTAVGLGERVYHHPNQLSGGQQQRVAIARALINKPPLIFADEPTGNLDTKTSIEVMKIFQELNDKGITILLVTHEKDIAWYSKRVIELKDGHIKKDFLIEDRRTASEELKNFTEDE